MNYNNIKLNLFHNVQNPKVSGTTTFGKVVNNYVRGFRQDAYDIRKYDKHTNRKEYDYYRTKMPAVCFNATFNNNYKNLDNLDTTTGIMFLDIDFDTRQEVSDFIINYIRDNKTNNKYIFAYWHSASKYGLHILVKVSGITTNEEFNSTYDYISSTYFDNKLDKNGKSLTRFTILPLDSSPYINEDSINIKRYQGDTIINEDKKVSLPLTIKKKRKVRGNDTFLNNTSGDTEFKSGLDYKTFLDDDRFEDVDKPLYIADGMVLDCTLYPKYRIRVGNRNATIGALSAQLIELNGHKVNRDTLFNGIHYINRWYSEEPLETNEVNKIFNKNMKRYHDDTLCLDKYYKPKKIFWSRKCKLTQDEKHKLAMKTIGKYKTDFNKDMIYETLEYLQNGNKITMMKIAEHSTLSLITIKRYMKKYPELQELYRMYNVELKEMK